MRKGCNTTQYFCDKSLHEAESKLVSDGIQLLAQDAFLSLFLCTAPETRLIHAGCATRGRASRRVRHVACVTSRASRRVRHVACATSCASRRVRHVACATSCASRRVRHTQDAPRCKRQIHIARVTHGLLHAAYITHGLNLIHTGCARPPKIPTRASIAEPTAILCSTGPGDSVPSAS